MILFLENEEQEIIDIRRTALLSHFWGTTFRGWGLVARFTRTIKNDGNKRE